jgi:hypothetical protein
MDESTRAEKILRIFGNSKREEYMANLFDAIRKYELNKHNSVSKEIEVSGGFPGVHRDCICCGRPVGTGDKIIHTSVIDGNVETRTYAAHRACYDSTFVRPSQTQQGVHFEGFQMTVR